jgi:hypothetical protein
MPQAKCLNCSKPLHDAYCAHCGQSAHTHRLNWKHFLHDIPHSVFHIDKGFFYTAKELFKHPGTTVRSFLDGKRISHFRPITYALFLGVIISLSILAENVPQEVKPVEADPSDADVHMAIDGGTINYLFSKYYGLLVILCVPVYAFFAWLFYRKERNFVEIVTGFLFIYAHTTWFGLLLLIARFVDHAAFQEAMVYVFAVLSFLFVWWGHTTMFTSYKPLGRALRGLLIFALGFIFAGIALLMGIYAFQQLH